MRNQLDVTTLTTRKFSML